MKKGFVLVTVLLLLISFGSSNVFAADMPDEKGEVLAFTGDQHGEGDTYREWIETMKTVYGDDLVLLTYIGDICDKNWDPQTFESFKNTLDELMPGRYNVTTGNQEFKKGAPGPAWDDLGEGFTRIGEAIRTDNYIVYNLGSADEKMVIPEEDLGKLDAYLSDVPDTIPVFIAAHYPLHLSVQTDAHEIPGPDGYRQLKGNGKLLEILNRHPNVIFLWGHNHTFQDPRYGTILTAGSAFTYDITDTTARTEIRFTYANYGSFCRTDTYGLIAEVVPAEEEIQVKLYYVDADVPDAARDSAVIHYAKDGTVTAEVTTGTNINEEDILAMSGYSE